jgi:pyruvate-formate lyase-activating enzyme
MDLPYLAVSDGCGDVFEIPEYLMAGMTLNRPVLPEPDELILLPQGSDLLELPGRTAVGYDAKTGEFVEVQSYHGNPVYAVAAFMAPAYLQYYRAAYRSRHPASQEGRVDSLPLYAYTAVGWRDGGFYVTGTRIDSDERQDLKNMDRLQIESKAREMVERYPHNRLVKHLVENCVFRYACPAARNMVLKRWECPLPTSPACNARCLGCLSSQPGESGIAASQERLSFVPTPEEIAQIAVDHLETAPRAVVSFGQGCEGEPLMVGDVIERSIRIIRSKSRRGVINLNTNASLPNVVERLCRAGLDSIRVSLNSAQEPYYNLYYEPQGYRYSDVVESLLVARRFGLWISLNYLVFPGLTDDPRECAALHELLQKVQIDMIQTRNLNIDPDWYLQRLGLEGTEAEPCTGRVAGVRDWVLEIRKRFPSIKLGYFNPPREEILKFRMPRS